MIPYIGWLVAALLYLLGSVAVMKLMDYHLALNEDDEFFFLSKKLDIIIIVFWPCFIAITAVIELFGPDEK